MGEAGRASERERRRPVDAETRRAVVFQDPEIVVFDSPELQFTLQRTRRPLIDRNGLSRNFPSLFLFQFDKCPRRDGVLRFAAVCAPPARALPLRRSRPAAGGSAAFCRQIYLLFFLSLANIKLIRSAEHARFSDDTVWFCRCVENCVCRFGFFAEGSTFLFSTRRQAERLSVPRKPRFVRAADGIRTKTRW